MNDGADLSWRGPFATLPRAMDPAMVRDVAATAATFAGLAALAIVPFLVGLVELPGANRRGLLLICAGAAASGLAQLRLRTAPERLLAWLHPTVTVSIFLVGPVLMVGAVVFAGDAHSSVSVFYVEFLLLAYVLLRLPWAVAVTGAYLVGFAVALILVDDPIAPAQEFINVLASAVVAGALIGRMTSRLDIARRDLADLNHNLEQRVADQVAELERAGRLRRFLSPQIADVVLSSESEGLLAPHRRDVSVLFIDLRGFTAFTNAVGPERIMQVLDEYYEAVGELLDAHSATIGGFDGDGVMAYLGDPVPVAEPALAAIRVATEIASRLDALVRDWSADGPTLGYGIGIAYGTATLGVVGSRGRSDYTPVGAVVNLAARLCADARHGEIVLDEAMYETTGAEISIPRASVDLKGFGTVPTYAVVR